MKKAILKKIALILFISASTVSINGKDDIVLIDDTKKSSKVQKNVIGCDDTAKKGELKCSKSRTAEDRDRDIEDIQKKLNDILQQLAEIKKENNSNIQNNKIAKIKDSIKRLTGESRIKSAYRDTVKDVKVIAIKSDHVIIEVQSGECLSKYAQKYYGDSSKYHKIYRANRDKIGKDLQVFIGDRLIIPTSDSYKY
jgi:adenylosuccinate synthase